MTVSSPSMGLPSARARSVICMSMPSCGSNPVLISANCVSTMAAAQGSSLAITDLRHFERVRRASRPRAYCSAPMTSSSVCWSRQRAVRGDELHRVERIHVVEIHFHDDDVGRAVGAFELLGESSRVILRQRVHGAGEVDGVVLALQRPHRGVAAACAPARADASSKAPARPRARPRRIASGKDHAADSAAVRKCTPVSMAPLECSVSSR